MYGMVANVLYMTLMYATYDKALKIHHANVIYVMHIEKLQNRVLLVVVAFQTASYLYMFVSVVPDHLYKLKEYIIFYTDKLMISLWWILWSQNLHFCVSCYR